MVFSARFLTLRRPRSDRIPGFSNKGHTRTPPRHLTAFGPIGNNTVPRPKRGVRANPRLFFKMDSSRLQIIRPFCNHAACVRLRCADPSCPIGPIPYTAAGVLSFAGDPFQRQAGAVCHGPRRQRPGRRVISFAVKLLSTSAHAHPTLAAGFSVRTGQSFHATVSRCSSVRRHGTAFRSRIIFLENEGQGKHASRRHA